MRLILAFLFAIPAPLAAQEASSEPSLVEVARKQRERKKSAQKKSRMITNADLKTFRSARITTTAAITQSETKPGATGTQNQVKEDKGKDVESWKSTLAEAQLDIKHLVNKGLVLKLKMNNLQNAFFIEADGTTRGMLQAQLSETVQEIELNKEEIEKARKELAKLLREARKSGVPGKVIRQYR